MKVETMSAAFTCTRFTASALSVSRRRSPKASVAVSNTVDSGKVAPLGERVLIKVEEAETTTASGLVLTGSRSRSNTSSLLCFWSTLGSILL